MKILFLPSHYILDDHQYGSEADLAYNVVNRIASQYRDSVVVTGRKNLIQAPGYRVIEVMPSFRRFDMSFVSAVKFNVCYTAKALHLLRSEQFDLVHHVRPFALGQTFNLAILLGAHKQVPFVIGAFCSTYLVKGVTSPEKVPSKKDNVFRLIEKLIQPILNPLSYATLRKADVVFVYDHYTEKLVLEKVPKAKIVLVTPGKDGSKYYYDSSKQFEKGKLTFLSAGNFVSRKGFDSLIVAFSKIAKAYPEARLKIVGDGYEEAALRALTGRLGLDNQVIFPGRVANKAMPDIYASSDVYVSMPLEEAFGHVYIEALATGLPIIATSTIGTEEILSAKPFGKIIPQGDVAAMAARMKFFLNHPEVLPELSRQARNEFENRYDWSVIIPRYIAAYAEALASKKDN